ncbi:unnamed protein product [Cylicocyclus nassatus]|uniref:Uncharacterized protein n=1 Tax=Cylicocyclus nassatus TaxID=53992 RepID=A0AA36HEE3_CYLNA|nr:unnamed protein product [Cylicocyclus nassatus]
MMPMVDKTKRGYDVVLRSELDQFRDVEQEIEEQQEETRDWVQQQIDNALNKGKERDLQMKNEAQKQHELLLKEISDTN